MDKVELKVNVINQLKLLRQSTFKDILCFLDEDIQNAQRAKASEVRINLDKYNKILIIENNGKLLDNPQALFSIAESEWDDDVKTSENPFGMGFFSNITVSNLIKVHSGNKLITFDVENMILTNNTEIKIEEIEDFYDGFKLSLENFDFNKVYSWNIEERVKVLGRYIHELDIYYDNKLQEKKDLTIGDDSDLQIVFDNDDLDFKGWISLGNNYDYGAKLNIFYKGRLVSKLDDVHYLKGDLHVSDKTLNLTSPDRKDIIKDSKLSNFRNQIRENVKQYCNDLLISGEYDISEFSTCISHYVDKNEVKNKIKFMTFKSDKKDDLEYLRGIALARRDNSDINSFKDYELFLRKDDKKQSEEFFDQIEIDVA